MDVNIIVENVNETLNLSVSISWSDTNETMIHHIADSIDSLPEYLEWDVVPSWTSLETTVNFKCINYLSFLKDARDIRFPENVPKTEKYQTTFLLLHHLSKKPKYLNYFNQQDFTIPLNGLNIVQDYNDDLQRHNKILKERDSIMEIGDGDNLHTEDAITKYKRFVVKTNFTDISVVFDTMRVSHEIPFIMYKGVLKTLNHFRPPQEWLEMDSEHGIIFKIKHNNKADYSTGVVVLEDVCYCILDTSDFYKFIDENILLDNLKTSLNDDNLLLTEQSTFLTYSLIGIEFHNCYLADLVMHRLYSLFYIDEYIKPSKNTNRIYLHMVDDTGTINLFQKFTQKPFQFNVTQGTPYMFVRIKTDTVFMAQRLKMIVFSLIGFYKQNVNSVTKFYKNYIPIKPKHTEFNVAISKKKPLKLIAPEIFLPMYSRRCLNMPSIVTSIKKNQPFIKFPLFGESQTRIYVCEHQKYKYPGLRVNELDNRDKFPFVPCCYSKDQQLIPDSKLNKYINKTVVTPKIKHSQGAILNLPVVLKQYFTFVDILNDYILLSNPAGPISFPNAVHYALHKQHISQETVEKISAQNLNICAQEDFPPNIQDGIFPTKHIRLLEVFYNVSIFLFDKHGPILPLFKSRYLKSAPKKKSVFVFVKEDNHCLPLVRTGAPTSYFPYTNMVGKIYLHAQQLAPHEFSNQSTYEYFSRYKVTEQILNKDNHCVFFICLINNKRIPVATEPQLPFAAPVADGVFRLKDYKHLIGIFKRFKVVVVDGVVKEVLVPFSSTARILCDFRVADLDLEKSTGKELFPNIVNNIDNPLAQFFDTRKQIKTAMSAVENFIVKQNAPLDQEPLREWLTENERAITRLVGYELSEADKEKVAYVIALKNKNIPHRVGSGRDLDLQMIEPKENQIVSANKEMMLVNKKIVKYKPHLNYTTIGDKILVSGIAFENVDKPDDENLPELTYNPETHLFYSEKLVTTDDAAAMKSFKTWFWGNLFVFERVVSK